MATITRLLKRTSPSLTYIATCRLLYFESSLGTLPHPTMEGSKGPRFAVDELLFVNTIVFFLIGSYAPEEGDDGAVTVSPIGEGKNMENFMVPMFNIGGKLCKDDNGVLKYTDGMVHSFEPLDVDLLSIPVLEDMAK
ncbi:hypothetical protein PIB30_014052 [Stylosanthes scabra]|uniref:PB1-like domain-containing protein n=1 Tax=Stylosanthes scabra TaxID=79078 RepID=A0ABU6Q7D3_9FABA|nr:hypothetical protein [Stylosanthes scabra]